MREQSHKDEMSRALRGDFERLRERGVSTTLAPRADVVVPQDAGADAEHELVPEVEEISERKLPVELVEEQAPAVAEPQPEREPPEHQPDVEPDGHAVPASRPGLFARLIGR